MKIEFLRNAGIDAKTDAVTGEVIEVEKHIAHALIQCGAAKLADEGAKVGKPAKKAASK
ncbi:hypothetical protein KUW19_00200 [Ferrimonas balearica]|uniref:hypothetical protein n=1 Tax=Ferrimonas balearica TaxID=44012 RepID=UPI001C97AFDC|nr:hypothetical protein [Ferrimonas balearica]MBY6104902.1 hypothetical protein [Ferrimonas balearica]